MPDTNPTIYLAGPIRDVPDNGTEWRKRLQYQFEDEYELLSPLSKYDVPVDELQIVDGAVSEDLADVVGTDDIVDGDLDLIDRADGLLVGYINTGRMVGTPMEVMYARHVIGMPVAIWIRDGTSKQDMSPWFQSLATTIAETPETAIEHIESQYDGE